MKMSWTHPKSMNESVYSVSYIGILSVKFQASLPFLRVVLIPNPILMPTSFFRPVIQGRICSGYDHTDLTGGENLDRLPVFRFMLYQGIIGHKSSPASPSVYSFLFPSISCFSCFSLPQLLQFLQSFFSQFHLLFCSYYG